MGPFDAIIQLLLFACFGFYIFMGVCFLSMGTYYYAYAEGAVGTTGIYLILIGLLMLIIGGIAVFANLKKIWLILFVIELVNVALFLVRWLPCGCLATAWLLLHVRLLLHRPTSCAPRPIFVCILLTDRTVLTATDPVRHNCVRADDGDGHHRPCPPRH